MFIPYIISILLFCLPTYGMEKHDEERAVGKTLSSFDKDFKTEIFSSDQIEENELVAFNFNGRWQYAQVSHLPCEASEMFGIITAAISSRIKQGIAVDFKKLYKLPPLPNNNGK